MPKLALAVTLSIFVPVYADVAYPSLVPSQMASQSEAVVVGKIVEVEKDTLVAASFPQTDGKTEYKMATVKITDRLLGAAGITQIRIGFAPVNPGYPRGAIPMPAFKTEVGTEACLFLVPHPSGDFYVLTPWSTPLSVEAKNYKQQFDEVKKVTTIFANPLKSLIAKEQADRAFAARTLVTRYRSTPPGIGRAGLRNEEISANESKLILSALAEMPWVSDASGPGRSTVWYQLNVSAKDGFKQPKVAPGADANQAMDRATAEWLKENKDRFRIKRLVANRK